MALNYTDKLYDRLLESKEYQAFRSKSLSIENNIQQRDFDSLFSVIKDGDVIWRLRDVMEETFTDIITELLGDMLPDKLRISASHTAVRIDLPYEEGINYEYRPYHWGSTPHSLVEVDFENKIIEIMDTREEYEMAFKYFQENIKTKETELQELLDKISEMEANKKSRNYMLATIRKAIWSLNWGRYFIFHTACYFSTKKYKALQDAFEEMIAREKQSSDRLIKKIKEMKTKNFVAAYSKVESLQAEIKERLKALDFEVKTVVIKYERTDEIDD